MQRVREAQVRVPDGAHDLRFARDLREPPEAGFESGLSVMASCDERRGSIESPIHDVVEVGTHARSDEEGRKGLIAASR